MLAPPERPGDEAPAPGILDVRLSGPPELVAEALAALRLVLAVVDESRLYPNRRDVGGRVYVKASGLTPEAREFLTGRRR